MSREVGRRALGEFYAKQCADAESDYHKARAEAVRALRSVQVDDEPGVSIARDRWQEAKRRFERFAA